MKHLLLAVALLSVTPATAAELTVGAAASLKDALSEVGAAFTTAQPKTTVAFNFAASSALVQQIRAGATIDVFFAADRPNMDKVTKDLSSGTRADVLAGELALIVPASIKTTSSVNSIADLERPDVKRIALCDDAVPAGHYGRLWLTHRGLLAKLTSRLVKPENVRSVLAMVASGTVDAGFVYVTDAMIEKDRVRIVDRATRADGVDVRYPAAVLAHSKHPDEARRFVAFLRTDTARVIFQKFGFTPL